METGSFEQQSRSYAVVAEAIHYLIVHAQDQPSLDTLAGALHLSPFHLQRVFSRWAGLTPKRFQQFLSKEYAREALARSANLDSAAAASGLSGSSRLHDLMLSCEAMTPAEVRAGGAGLLLRYGMVPSPFGMALLAWTVHGVCHLEFMAQRIDPTPMDAVDTHDACPSAALLTHWPHADWQRDDAEAAAHIALIFRDTGSARPLHLVLRGTNLQIKVWEALMRTKPGELLSYGQLAQRIGMGKAARAVGSAVAQNTLAYLIPCHRVIRESGVIGEYRWGRERKHALLAWEASRLELRTAPSDKLGGAAPRRAPPASDAPVRT